jgi:hypothetical protein
VAEVDEAVEGVGDCAGRPAQDAPDLVRAELRAGVGCEVLAD